MADLRVEKYRQGGKLLESAIAGLSATDMRARPVPNTWSIAEITIHLMDSDLVLADRMKRIIAEDNPTLIGFDESAFAKNLFYNDLDPHSAVDILQRNRMMMCNVLERLPENAFHRFGTHNQRGKITLGAMLAACSEHLEHHLKFILHKRQLLGKPVQH